MLLHLYGSDSYRRLRASREIIAKYLLKYPDGLVQTFDCAREGAVDSVRAFIGAPGLFAKTTLAIVRSPEEGEKALAKLLRDVGELAHVTVLVVADKKLPKDFSFLYEKSVGPAKKEFEPLEGMEFLKFLKADSVERGVRIPDATLAAIGESYAGDTWGAVTEIDTVASGGVFEKSSKGIDFIGLIRTLAGGGANAQRLRALFLLLEHDDPAKVFNMTAAFTRGTDKVQMADYDIAIKSGRLEYSEALLDFVLS